jgi:methylation protein EvaC
MNCKITNTKIKPFMSFGKMPIANAFIKKKNFEDEFFFDLEVGFSEKISLFQLKDHPSPSQMFNNKYPFYTSSSEAMKSHFKDFSDYIVKNYLKNDSRVIEVGSNDGTFLKNFKSKNFKYVGFEPSSNVANFANKNDIFTINEFFNTESVELIKDFKTKTDVVYAANVICHIPDLINFIKTVDKLLTNDGVLIFEEPYLGSMIEKTSYDQIYDEHIYMFSATSVKKIFELYDFELIDTIKQVTHGGSMRYVISRKKKNSINKNVEKILDEEKRNNLDNIQSCLSFKKNCEISKKRILNLLNKFKTDDKRIVGYAATSKSTTILNYCNIDDKIIDYICDTTEEKIGKYSPGMHIPIVSIDHFRKDDPDAVYLFAWNHKNEIFKKENSNSSKKINWFSHINI